MSRQLQQQQQPQLNYFALIFKYKFVFRTTVEMEPHTGEVYTVQQGPGGVRMAKSSRVRVSQQEDMMGHRRPTHISEARLATLETNL